MKRYISHTLRLWQQHRVSRVAAALSFYMLFSFAPVLVALVFLARLILAHTDALRVVDSELALLVGSKGAQGADVLVRASERRIAATPLFIGGGLLIFAIVAIFMQVQEALDDVWSIPSHRRGGVRETIFHRLHIVIAIAALALLGLFALLAAVAGGRIAAFGVNIVALGLSLTIAYHVLPRAEVSWKNAALGAIVTGAIILAGEAIVSFYFTHFHPETAFGAAGSFLIILIWMYYSAQLFLFGAVLTRVLEGAE